MLNATDNETLTRTGAQTPMGRLFRQFWIPVLLAEQLSEPDGPQVRVKVLGEDLLVFRDTSGRIGLISPRCPHRGANLFYGRNEQDGVRCAFHGWKFNYRGECVDAPTIDPEHMPRVCEKAKITAYPATEWGGMVWAYMGPREAPPPLPEMEFALLPPSHRHVSKKFQECNWAQAAEGGVDTAHFSFLHLPIESQTGDMKDKAKRALKGYSKDSMNHEHVQWMREDARPRFSIVQHDAGMVLGGARNAAPGKQYWRITQYLLPSHGYSPSATPGQTYHGQTWIPIDDESCWIYIYSWNPERPITDEERRTFDEGGAVYPAMDENWHPIRNRSNDHLLDRNLQKTENFSGIIGVSEQDAAIQDSQGRIADRTKEILGPTDMGVVRFRRLMLGLARDLDAGKEPLAVDAPQSYRVRAGGIVADAQASFEEVMGLRFNHALGLTTPVSMPDTSLGRIEKDDL